MIVVNVADGSEATFDKELGMLEILVNEVVSASVAIEELVDSYELGMLEMLVTEVLSASVEVGETVDSNEVAGDDLVTISLKVIVVSDESIYLAVVASSLGSGSK